MPHRVLSVACSGLTLAIFAALPAKANDCATPGLENTVKMEPLDGPGGGDQGEVTVPVTLNGVEKKFLFDTGGGTMNYVSDAVVFKLGLFKTNNFVAMDLAGNKSYSVAGVRNLKFGAARGRDIMFQIVPGLAFDGILSAGTMANDDLDMDFGAMRLNFFSADHCPGGVVYWPHQALAVVPVTLAGGHFELATILDGHPLTAAIDTGSSWTILNIGWAEKNPDFSPDTSAPRSSGMPRDQPDKQVYFRKYSALSFPGITITKPLVVVVVVVVRPMAEIADHSAPDIIIGMEVLRHLHLYYAASEHKLYITPASPGASLLPTTVTSSVRDHAWPQNAEPHAYAYVWDPVYRPH